MAILDKKEVLKRIRPLSRTKGGKPYTSFEIYFGTDGHGKKIREEKTSETDARSRVDEFFRTHKKVGDAATLLKPGEIHDAAEAKRLLEEAGIRSTLTDAIRKFIGDTCDVTKTCAPTELLAAYDEYYAGIPDIQNLHKKCVKDRVRPWVMHTGPSRRLDEITSKDMAEYLKPMRKASLKTYNNHLSYIKTFLNWCTKSERRYLMMNPLADMKTEKIAYREPEFMAVDVFERLIRAVEVRKDARQLIPYLVLSYFCGVRREEIARLKESPEDINLEEGTVRISMPKGWTQGIKPRMFQLQPNALAWMRAFYNGKGPLCKSNKACMWIFDDVAKKLGIKLGHNTGRHSFITYHVAAFNTPAMTDSITGTSSKMRSAHYQGLTGKKSADAFFAIMPTVKGVAKTPAT